MFTVSANLPQVGQVWTNIGDNLMVVETFTQRLLDNFIMFT